MNTRQEQGGKNIIFDWSAADNSEAVGEEGRLLPASVEKERKTKLAQLLEENCGWQVEHYSNLIPVAVDSLKYLSSLSFDILPFVMIEHLSGDCALHHCHFL